MSASFQFSESNGATPTVTDGVTSINFGSSDAPNLVPASHPVTAGTNSFEKWIRGHFYGVYNSVANLKFYLSAGSYVTGEQIVAAVTASFWSANFSARAPSAGSLTWWRC